MVPLADMFVDVGASSRAEAEAMGLRAGLPVAYATKFQVMNGTRRYLAKAFDDRAGLAVINEALRRLQGRARGLPVPSHDAWIRGHQEVHADPVSDHQRTRTSAIALRVAAGM